MADDKPIIVIKKKGGHGGHHGGAWKVAYADFVTAMMAFFMVMWLVNSAETTTKQNIASYFRRPGIFQSGSGTPLLIGESGILNGMPPPMGTEKGKKGAQTGASVQYKKKSGTDDEDGKKQLSYRGEDDASKPLNTNSENAGVITENPGDHLSRAKLQEQLEEIAEEIKQKIAAMPELSELLGVVDIKVDADGLKIEIMDTDKSSMFASGSASITSEAKEAFFKVADILKKLPTSIEILGHTDSQSFGKWKGGYSNWELSSDRANAARRLLEWSGVEPDRITSVVGRADKELRNTENPMAAANRRISLKMKFDFTKDLDLSKDPAALDKLPEYKKEYEDKRLAVKDEKAKKVLEDKAHALSAKEILEKKEKGIVVIPQDYEKKQEEITHTKDKIFGNSPVLAVPDIIYGDN
jgi:chemotaxis protein MotB